MIERIIGMIIGLGIYRVVAALIQGDKEDAAENGLTTIVLVLVLLVLYTPAGAP